MGPIDLGKNEGKKSIAERTYERAYAQLDNTHEAGRSAGEDGEGNLIWCVRSTIEHMHSLHVHPCTRPVLLSLRTHQSTTADFAVAPHHSENAPTTCIDQIKRITCEEETAEAPIPMCTAQLQRRISCRLHRQARSLALHAIDCEEGQSTYERPPRCCVRRAPPRLLQVGTGGRRANLSRRAVVDGDRIRPPPPSPPI
jgi:hypothetical protein